MGGEAGVGTGFFGKEPPVFEEADPELVEPMVFRTFLFGLMIFKVGAI